MLNKDGQRELAYVVNIDHILSIEGADRVETAIVGGWRVLVRKGQFKPGDPAIYFEIDSRLPETEPYKFMESKGYKVKTQKYFKGTVISQGLLMGADDFGWTKYGRVIIDNKGVHHDPQGESRFLTKQLGITYYDPEDNKRKATPISYSADKHIWIWKWLMKRSWGRWLLGKLGLQGSHKSQWPAWIKRSDEERIQNMPWILEDKEPWIVTEKIDGSSTSFAMYRNRWPHQNDYYVCSRNVVLYSASQKAYYETPKNYYWEMAEKYHMKEVLEGLLKDFPCADWVYIQGETYGEGVQKSSYSLKGRDLAVFNLVFSHCGRVNSVEMKAILAKYNVPCVPILNENFILPDTVDEMLEYADGISDIDGGMREGVVLRSLDGQRSFKAVSNKYLMKYH